VDDRGAGARAAADVETRSHVRAAEVSAAAHAGLAPSPADHLTITS